MRFLRIYLLAMSDLSVLRPDWPAPAQVHALSTTRAGGVSLPPYASLNLGLHVGDDPVAVTHNRARLRQLLPAEPVWLNQVHGVQVVDAAATHGVPDADASFSRQPGVVCAVMTADCLPVLFTNRAGSVVAAAHAGWRGLLAGVLEATLDAMACPPGDVLAWLGPAISCDAFEVGAEVREAFVRQHASAASAFSPLPDGKFLADLPQLARQRLGCAGVLMANCFGGDACTVIERELFFSYRRDGVTGRMASAIWLA